MGQVDRVIVVIDEAKERIMDYGIPESKVAVISNAEDTEYFKGIKLDQNIVNRYKDELIISYIGGFGPHRGIETTIRAMKYFKGTTKEKLLLVGSQSQIYENELRQLARDYDVQSITEIVRWQPFEKVPSYIEVSDIGLIPHNKNPHTDSTIPNKLFQYMLLGKPVIVSDCRPLKRIVEETECGLVFQSGNERDLADKMIELYEGERKRRKLGENGRRAVLEKYNWESEAEKLLALYEGLSA